MVTPGSNKAHWWRCEQKHDWPARVADRAAGTRCPKCSGATLDLGRNDFQSVSPTAAKQWHPTLNGEVLPSEVLAYSHRKYWFACGEEQHVYAAELASRSAGSGCGYCSGNIVLAGFNDLGTKLPRLVSEWHPTRNGSLNASMVTAHSKQLVYWKCMEGHTWQAAVYSRASGKGCRVCSGQQALLGYNTLHDLHPEIARQWLSAEKQLSPTEVTASSGVKVTWRCDAQHTWIARVAERTSGQKCPYCSRKRPWGGETDLGTLRTDVAAWWHPTKNKLTPRDYTEFSNAIVFWLCPKGHVWEARIAKRSLGHGCPECSDHGSSGIERRFCASFGSVLADVVGGRLVANKSEHYARASFKVDIEGEWNGRRVIVEYDGVWWHGNQRSLAVDESKTRALLEAGYVVVRIRENALPFLAIRDPRLLQLTYRNVDATPAAKEESVARTTRHVEAWFRTL